MPDAPHPTHAALFGGFFGIGMLGFGGVLPWARRMVVDQRAWLDGAEFVDLLALCQFLPGPNICNMSVVLGRRYHGVVGAVAALSGLMAAPVVIAVALASLYQRFAASPIVAHLFVGLAAAASGLIVGTAVKLALPLARSSGREKALALMALTFALIALVRLPLVPTMLALAPFSVWLHRARPAVQA